MDGLDPNGRWLIYGAFVGLLGGTSLLFYLLATFTP